MFKIKKERKNQDEKKEQPKLKIERINVINKADKKQKTKTFQKPEKLMGRPTLYVGVTWEGGTRSVANRRL